MKFLSKPVAAALMGACVLACGAAQAGVVNFDNLPGDGAMPSMYGGLTWDPGWYYISSAFAPFEAHSSPTRVYSVADEGGFGVAGGGVFEGAWFAGFYYVSFSLYSAGQLVHTSATLELFGDGQAQFLASGFGGPVDRVVVSGVGGGYVMDDVAFADSAPQTPELPEPDAPALMAAGLLAAGAARMSGTRVKPKAVRVR